MRKKLLFVLCIAAAIAFSPLIPSICAYGKTASYTISDTTAPSEKKYRKLSSYNKYTKNYYTIVSYIKKISKKGGGTLILKKGTYLLPCTVYIPSNTTIKLMDGAYIKKTVKTGSKKLKPSSTMFELCDPGKKNKKDIMKGYLGSNDITITGTGKAAIGQCYHDGTVIVSGHNNNVKISGIKFKYLKNGNFIKIQGSNNVTVSNCRFYYHRKSKTGSRPAVLIDTPDDKLEKESFRWLKRDRTPCRNITVKGCTFLENERGIASNKFTKGKYQKDITVTKNTFRKIDRDAVSVINWENAKITSNTFDTIGQGFKVASLNGYRAVSLMGAKNPSVVSNTFKNLSRPIGLGVMRNSGRKTAKEYGDSKNSISKKSLESMLKKNSIKNTVVEHYIRNYKTYGSKVYTRYEFYDKRKTVTISKKSVPSIKKYRNSKYYNSKTRDYFVLRSAVETLEKKGGGIIYMKAGTYYITNVIAVPSNVKIILKEGCTIKKSKDTGSKKFKAAGYMFTFAAPSKFKSHAVKGYSGVKNSGIVSETSGKGIISMNGITGCAVVFGHNTGCFVENVKFTGRADGHDIEVDAAKNCIIKDNYFTDGTNPDKEAINVDTPDSVTGGFTGSWSSMDKTPCLNLYIQDNTFTDMPLAVGTHCYSSGKPHVYVKIDHNRFTKIKNKAVLPMNWKNASIIRNTFTCTPKLGVIYARGVNNMNVENNTFTLSKKDARVYHFRPAYHVTGSSAKLKVKPVYNAMSDRYIKKIRKKNRYKGKYKKTVSYVNSCTFKYVKSEKQSRYVDGKAKMRITLP